MSQCNLGPRLPNTKRRQHCSVGSKHVRGRRLCYQACSQATHQAGASISWFEVGLVRDLAGICARGRAWSRGLGRQCTDVSQQEKRGCCSWLVRGSPAEGAGEEAVVGDALGAGVAAGAGDAPVVELPGGLRVPPVHETELPAGVETAGRASSGALQRWGRLCLRRRAQLRQRAFTPPFRAKHAPPKLL